MLASLNLSHFAEDSDKRQTDSFLCCILPNIRRKNRRDIDGTLDLSSLPFEGIVLCVAKLLEIFVVECCHSSLCRQSCLRILSFSTTYNFYVCQLMDTPRNTKTCNTKYQ